MRIEKNEAIGHLAARYPHVVRLFESWGVDYCCSGHRRVGELCALIGITVGELAMQVELSAPESAAPERNWLDEPLSDLIRFIVDYYHRQTRDRLDRLEALARRVEQTHAGRHPEVVLVSALIHELSKDLRPHMLKEEQVLFPFIKALDVSVRAGEIPPTPFFGSLQHPIGLMTTEHAAVAELFERIRAASGDYELPPDACSSYASMYEALQELEEMTHQHIHLENNVLFPRARRAEEQQNEPLVLVGA